MSILTPAQKICDRLDDIRIELKTYDTIGMRKKNKNKIKALRVEKKALKWVVHLYNIDPDNVDHPTIGGGPAFEVYRRPSRPKY